MATPNAAQITDVRWIHLGSVTHAFDMGQRANTLTFTRTATGVDVTAPANQNLAPPGHYQAVHPEPERGAVGGGDHPDSVGALREK